MVLFLLNTGIVTELTSINMTNPIIEDFKAQLKSGSPITRLILFNVVVFVAISLLRIILFLFGGSQLYSEIVDLLFFHISLQGFIKMPWTIITYMFTHEG